MRHLKGMYSHPWGLGKRQASVGHSAVRNEDEEGRMRGFSNNEHYNI
jgi:hypothetical protein